MLVRAGPWRRGLSLPQQLLLASFRPIIHWVMISDSLPWLCPSLLGLAAGVVYLHHCEGERRGTGRAGLRSTGGDERMRLHCTARMATDPEIAGV